MPPARAIQGCADASVLGWVADSILIHTHPPIKAVSHPTQYKPLLSLSLLSDLRLDIAIYDLRFKIYDTEACCNNYIKSCVHCPLSIVQSLVNAIYDPEVF